MYVVISNWYLIYHDYDGKLFHRFYGPRKIVEIYKKKSAVFHQQCEHWKAENVKTGLYIQFPKMMLMDSGVVCDGTLLHWGNLLKVYSSKTCKLRMSGILFSFGNSQFKICFIFMLILLLNIRLAVRHLWSPKMLG